MVTTEVTVSPEEASVSRSRAGAGPCVVVIFGASGDLTKRKLLPALYHLEQSGLLPAEFAVVGVARRPLKDEFVNDMRDGIIKGGGVEATIPTCGIFCNE